MTFYIVISNGCEKSFLTGWLNISRISNHHFRLILKHFGIIIIEIALGYKEGESGKVAGDGIVLHANFLGQPSLVVSDGGETLAARGYDTDSFGGRSLVHDIDAELGDVLLKAGIQGIRVFDMVHIESKQSAMSGVLVAAFLTAKLSLPTDSRQVALSVQIA